MSSALVVKEYAEILAEMMVKAGVHVKWKFGSVAAFILSEGVEGTFDGDNGVYQPYENGVEMGQCYKNAFLLSLQYPDLTYCEGYALPTGLIPMEHAWCLDSAGKVIDPTWEGEGAYLGVPFDNDWVYKLVVDAGVYGVLNYGKVMLGILETGNYKRGIIDH